MRFCGNCGTQLNRPTQSPPTQPPLTQSPPPPQCQEVDEDVEEKLDSLQGLLDVCEDEPDTGLEHIEDLMIDVPTPELKGTLHFAKAVAYCSKGLLLLARSKKPWVDFSLLFSENELRDYGITDLHLNWIEKGLHEIRCMESLIGYIAEERFDWMALVLERCRPGRVQEILSKTKILYFGDRRVEFLRGCEIPNQDFQTFCNIFLSPERIAKSAVFFLYETEEDGRRAVIAQLHDSLDPFSKEPSIITDFVLYSDGTYRKLLNAS
jgi:hypothetical protein